MKKRRFKVIIIITLVFLCGALSTAYFLNQKRKQPKQIKVSGSIEGDDVRLSFRVNGQIIELLTDEGEVIKKDQVVARLNTDELEKVEANAEATLKAAQYDYELAKLDYNRAENLLKEGAISQQKRDDAKTNYEATGANVEQQRASLELAQTRLGFTDLISPLDGFVLVKSALPGEVVQPGATVFTVINLDDIWVTAYINEYDLGRVKLGQKAYVETDTYRGKKYNGRVSFISSQTEFTPKYIQTNEERVKYVYRIKVRVDNSSLELKPGMPADAYVIIE